MQKKHTLLNSSNYNNNNNKLNRINRTVTDYQNSLLAPRLRGVNSEPQQTLSDLEGSDASPYQALNI